MRNLVEAYATAVGSWIGNLSKNNLNRTVTALDGLQKGTYGTAELGKDFYAFLRDLADFRAQAALGMIPVASLDISSTSASAFSNFVQVPAGSAGTLALTDVVNPVTHTALQHLFARANGGENAVRIEFDPPPPAGSYVLGSPDKKALFQGALYHPGSNELIALIVARTHVP